jgi:regulatory protein
MARAEIDWWQLAYQVKEKKFGDLVEKDWKQKQRQHRFLLNRGFNIDQINYAIALQASTDA